MEITASDYICLFLAGGFIAAALDGEQWCFPVAAFLLLLVVVTK